MEDFVNLQKRASADHTNEEGIGNQTLMPPPLQFKIDQSGNSESKNSGNENNTGLVTQLNEAFSTDFSSVKINTNSKQAEDLGAHAFASGNNVHFAPGKFQPDTSEGRELIGHEFAHVQQQKTSNIKSTNQKNGVGINDDKSLEADADAKGKQFANMGSSNGDTSQLKTDNSEASSESPFQLYGSQEHSDLGDSGSGNAVYNVPNPEPYKIKFHLTHGDLVMLSGDYFDPRDSLPDGSPNPNSLFLMMKNPSLKPGQMLGTQDEIIYAIYKIKPKDARFAKGGIWENLAGEDKFSDAVKEAHNNRYLNLAANNQEHFVAPKGKEEGPGGKLGHSAGGSYRALHEAAILEAYKAGQTNGDNTFALMREGAAQHFLTDYFAAGHVRTPRQSIRDYWGKLYPLFWSNLKKKIAMDIAIYINDNENLGYFASVHQIYDNLHTEIVDKTKELPPIGFDDLVSMVAHDLDNEEGLIVKNDVGIKWRTYGDSNLHKSQETKKHASHAVKLGIADVEFAYSLGSGGSSSIPEKELYEKVRSHGQLVDNGKYAPEQMVPHLVQEENGKQNWKAKDFSNLWVTKVRDDINKTYGDLIKESVKTGELSHQMGDMANKFPESQEVKGVFTVHPKKAFEKGFFENLQNSPFSGLNSIIHFDPSKGQSFNNTDDIVMDEVGKMNDTELQGLTLTQREKRIKNLLSGYTPEEEGDVIVKLFKTCPVGDRAKLYKLVENREWSGDFNHGWFTIDDDLWDDLSKKQLKDLKKLLNEGR